MIDGTLAPLLAAILGLLIGSFLNVCIYRVPRDLSVVAPRSFCPECGNPVRWYDNIPVLSYLLLGGRCRSCRQVIGWRYPVVEALTAVLFAASVRRFGWNLTGLKGCLFEALMIVLCWTDLEERILPDEFTLGGAVAGLLFAWFVRVPSDFAELLARGIGEHWQSILNALLGALLLSVPIWFVGWAYSRLRHRTGLGLGDVKLLVLLGIYLGVESGMKALLLGTVSGSVVSLGYILWHRKDPQTFEIPMGSFLCAAAAVVPLLGLLPEPS